MRPVKEAEPIIRKIYKSEIKPKQGKIDYISIKEFNYRVIIEDVNKVRMVTEIRRKDIDDYFSENKKESAIKNIIEALNSFKPIAD